ncbi:SIS domain-containing protein [Clostridium sp. AM58-1XD]|uniref:KpsF/GutQ family sugar-phosphate isomerase n=1 Tax=Clostridium sp. AM58-1XD TaxID=2292307 RepID=UPI000E4EBE2D|nr:SIS domain-containing protein [Clostridium sp. AM58-1XD]RGZ01574.1 SIS domain-containing protein [Clostridium sp. AM58-1XD]
MDIREKMKFVWNTEADELRRLCDHVDYEAAEQLIETLEKARNSGNRIFFAGVGTSAAAAKKAAHSFSCVEFPANFLSPGDAVHGGLGAVQKGDVAVLISKGGGTWEIVRMIKSLKEKGAFVVGVTESKESELGRQADLTVLIKIIREPDAFNMLATASTAAVTGFFDAAAICLMERSGYTRDQFAVIHTGGAVGDRLVNKKQ